MTDEGIVTYQWTVVHITPAVRDGIPVTVKCEATGFEINLESTVRSSVDAVATAMRDVDPSFSLGTPLACQLVDHATALQTIYNSGLLHCCDLNRTSRDIIRLWPECSLRVLTSKHLLHPLRSQGTIYFYWKVLCRISPIEEACPGETVRAVQVSLLGGTSDNLQAIIQVRRSATYGEFLALLGSTLEGAHMKVWQFVHSHLQVGKVLRADLLDIYLCPISVSPTGITMLKAIAVADVSSLDRVLRKLKWYDWHSDVPIGDILPPGENHQLIIVPRMLRPWELNSGEFTARLREQVFQVGSPPVQLTLDNAPHYIGRLLRQMVDTSEEEKGLGEWYEAMVGCYGSPGLLPLGGVAAAGDDPYTLIDASVRIMAVAEASRKGDTS
jgi:hypothetical protein